MSRCFALVPAAGHSSRMGQPKLLLPLGGRPLLQHTLHAWLASHVDHVIVIVRPGDEVLVRFLQDVVSQHPRISLVVPKSPPPDMKSSLQAALRHIEEQHAPVDSDAFLVAPADMPRLSPAVIDRLITQQAQEPFKILAPTLAGRRGHPVLFPWSMASAVHSLSADEGLSAIVHRTEPVPIPCDDIVSADDSIFADIDTPDDYQRASSQFSGQSGATG